MIRIQGHDYRLRYDSHLARDTKAAGNSCGNAEYITLDSSCSEGSQRSSFIHEIIEQIDSCLNLELSHQTICRLEAGLFQIISDNPKVFTMTLPEGDE